LETANLRINYFVLLHNVFGVFSVTGFKSLIGEGLESHARDVEAGSLLCIGDVEGQVVKGEKFSTFRLFESMI
jgi:hypothetical protein